MKTKIILLVAELLLFIPILTVSALDGKAVSEPLIHETQVSETTSIANAVNETTTKEASTVTVPETTTKAEIVSEPETTTTTECETTTVVRFYDEDDLYILSHLIYGESGGQSTDCQLAVGSVVLNRVHSSEFPNSISEVVYARGQYACTWDGNFDKTPSERAINNARYLLENGSQLPESVVYQAQFTQGSGVYTEIDGEYFCYA